jgi:hypothetical protein
MKATKAQVTERVEQILRIRLDGAEFWDIREFAREKEKEAGPIWGSERPLSDTQLYRYLERADKLIAQSCRSSRKRLLRRHLAQRCNLYAKALNSGDIRTALAVLADEAALLALYTYAAELAQQPAGTEREQPIDLARLTPDQLETLNEWLAQSSAAPADGPGKLGPLAGKKQRELAAVALDIQVGRPGVAGQSVS